MTAKRPALILPALFLGVVAASNVFAAISPSDLAARLARNEPLIIIDARSAIAYEAGHVPGAMNIPLSLLPYKPIPSTQLVVVYGDGLGVVDDGKALAVVTAKPGVRAEILMGGYAAWLADTRLTTVPAGVAPERLPGITYDQLVAAAKGDMVLVDLRGSGTPAKAASGSPIPANATVTAAGPDVLQQFASKIGVPVVKSGGTAAVAASRAGGAPGEPPRAAAAPTTSASEGRLLVLVADSDAAASEVARQLRASGQYRFTILIGGTETIRHEGRVGTGRMDGGVPVPNP